MFLDIFEGNVRLSLSLLILSLELTTRLFLVLARAD
jgi:hypothetical protein